MIVALTRRHFRDLTELTGTTNAVAALAETLDADFTDEGERYRHRDALSGLFAEWFSAHTAAEVTDALSASSVLWERYRTFAEVVDDERVTANPMFTPLNQPRIGEYLAPGLPVVDQRRLPPGGPRARARRRHRGVLAEWLGLEPRATIDAAHRIGHRSMSRLLTLLELAPGADDDTWIGPASGPEGKRAFGGQFVAQSLAAACRTVDRTACPPTCICSSCAAARRATPSRRSRPRWPC